MPTYGTCPGDCNCGPGLPCGEYLWDHRNASLRDYLINQVVLGNATGLGNESVDGFYFDDAWRDAPGGACLPRKVLHARPPLHIRGGTQAREGVNSSARSDEATNRPDLFVLEV